MTKKKQSNQQARENIYAYFKKADANFKKDKKEANKLVKKARRLAMKHKLRLGKLKRKFCNHCYSYLMPGTNARIRTREGKLIIYCQECKNYTRFPYKK